MSTSNRPVTTSKTSGVIPKGPARTKFLILGLVMPVVLLAILALLPLTWLDQLPELVPSHWDSSGQPDSFDSPLGLTLTLLGIGSATIVAMWALGFALGKELLSRRILVGANVFMAVLLGGIVLATLAAARNGNSAELDIDLGIMIATGAGVVFGGLAAFALRPEPKILADKLPGSLAPRTALGDHEVGVWVTRTKSTTGFIIAGATLVLMVGIMIASQLWWTSIFFILLSAVMVIMFAWDVRVDATGLTVVSVARAPKRHLPLDEIESAEVASISAMGDFGGYGLRTGFSGSTGIILRSGKALQVNMSGNRTFYLTIDDAESGAALLNTLIDRSRPTT